MSGPWIAFLVITVVLGGAAAFASGRALAKTWRAPATVGLAAAVLAAGVRFLHFALVEEPTGFVQALLAVVVLGGFAAAGYGAQRRAQMARQYPWLPRQPGSEA